MRGWNSLSARSRRMGLTMCLWICSQAYLLRPFCCVAAEILSSDSLSVVSVGVES